VADYSEKTFSDSGYFGFLKNKMPWVGSATIPYGHSSITHTTVVSAVAYRPAADKPSAQSLLFTVSVDHSLKVWSLEDGHLLRATDLLNEPPATSAKMKTWLDPSPAHLLTIIDRSFQPDHSFYLVSFSSAATGKFKFWAASHYTDDDGQSGAQFKNLIDLYPEDTFNAKPPSTTAPWIISEFRITPVPSQSETTFDLWVLWKSDTNFQVQNVRFDITDVKGTWGNWTTATSDTLHPPKPATIAQTSEDVSEHWLQWILYPGRFPDTVLESAQCIYEANYNYSTPPSGASPEPLPVKLTKTVSAAVQVSPADVEKYCRELSNQWDRFSRLCVELDKQRREALSLVSDPSSGFVWTVNVDGITALRECTETEVIWHNFPMHKPNIETLSERTPKRLGAGLKANEFSDAMMLVSAANELKASLEDSALDACVMRLQQEVVKDPLHSVSDSMWAFYERCLEQEVPEEAHEKIEDLFNSMDNPEMAYNSLMASLYHQQDSHIGSSRLTSFGAKVLVGGSQEVIHVNYELLWQLALLLVYLASADDTREFSRISNPEGLYHRLLGYLKEYEVLSWMARTSTQLTRDAADDDISLALTDLRVSGETTIARQSKRGSALQLLLPNSFGPSLPGPGKMSVVSLSLCIRKFLATLDLYDRGNGVTNVALALLNVNATGPATDFAKFLPSTAWGSYVKARIQLKARSYAMASSNFNKAAYGMCMFYMPSLDCLEMFD
jgi:nuclear pore complex protein Nup160